MASTYILKNIPSRKELEEMRGRYPDLNADCVEAFMALLRVASDILDATDAQLARKGTSQGKLCVLMQLIRDPKAALSPWELADMVGVTRATITGLIDGLERGGFVRRERIASDRRSIKVRLMPKGEKLLDSIMPERLRRIAGIMSGLKSGERRALTRLLGKISERLPVFEGS